MKRCIHIDADAFFVACEITRNPSLRGKPVVVGEDKKIITALSYEAKKCGIMRGMPVWEARKICKDIFVARSDFALYKQYSVRMHAIIAKYFETSIPYGIDECFCFDSRDEILLNNSVKQCCDAIKKELSLTVSCGIGSTKTLAKIGSKYNKPSGVCYIEESNREKFLNATSIGSVWGIGIQSTILLKRYNIQTALDFIHKPIEWVRSLRSIHLRNIWYELSGFNAYPIYEVTQRTNSITRSKTLEKDLTKKDSIIKEFSRHIQHSISSLKSKDLTYTKAQFSITYSNKVKQNHIVCFTVPQVSEIPLVSSAIDWVDTLDFMHPVRKTRVTLLCLCTKSSLSHHLFKDTHEQKFNMLSNTIHSLPQHIQQQVCFGPYCKKQETRLPLLYLGTIKAS